MLCSIYCKTNWWWVESIDMSHVKKNPKVELEWMNSGHKSWLSKIFFLKLIYFHLFEANTNLE
jgi:hypothetical protein